MLASLARIGSAAIFNSVGFYTVSIPGLTKLGGTVQVTAYNTTNRCKPADWGVGVDGTQIGVLCFDKTGAAADSQYIMTFVRSVPVGYGSDATTVGGYAWA